MQRRNFFQAAIVGIASLPSLIKAVETPKPKLLRGLGTSTLMGYKGYISDDFAHISPDIFENVVANFATIKPSFTQVQSPEQHMEIDFGVIIISPSGIHGGNDYANVRISV